MPKGRGLRQGLSDAMWIHPSLTAQMQEAAQNARNSHPLPEVKEAGMIPLRILVPLIVACALFMENLDATVLSTALPAIARDLHQSPIQLKLALTSYLADTRCFYPCLRLGCRSIRHADHLSSGDFDLCAWIRPLRIRQLHRDAGGGQGISGTRRGDDGAGGATCDLKDDSKVGTCRSACLADHAGIARTGAGTPGRRLYYDLFPLAMDLLDQFADGCSWHGACHAVHPECSRRNHQPI